MWTKCYEESKGEACAGEGLGLWRECWEKRRKMCSERWREIDHLGAGGEGKGRRVSPKPVLESRKLTAGKHTRPRVWLGRHVCGDRGAWERGCQRWLGLFWRWTSLPWMEFWFYFFIFSDNQALIKVVLVTWHTISIFLYSSHSIWHTF